MATSLEDPTSVSTGPGGDARPGAGAETSRNATPFVLGFAAALSAAVVSLLYIRPGVEPLFDQTFIGYHFSGGYPSFEEGIVAHLIVGFLNALVPFDPIPSNQLIRALAAAMYMGSAGLLAWSVTGRERLWGFVAFMLLIATSRFAWLWLSSELFAATFLMLLLWSLVRRQPFYVSALLLALFAFSKADLALPGALVGGYLVLRNDPLPRWKRALALGIPAAVVLLPAALFTTSYYAQFGGRAWVSFRQHYGELLRGHQLQQPAPPGFGGGSIYAESVFPGAESVVDVIFRYPRLYGHFVALSIAESVYRLATTGLVLLSLAGGFFFTRLEKSWRVIVLLLLANLVPVILISFLHVRYQARFYPLALFIIFLGLKTVVDGGSSGVLQGTARIEPARLEGRWVERGVAVLLGMMILWQLSLLGPVLETAYWLPD